MNNRTRKKWIYLVTLVSVLGFAPASQALTLVIQQNINVQMWQFGSVTPTPNQTLDTPPQTVSVNFSVAVKPEGSYIKIYDPYNNVVDTGPTRFDGNTMYVNFPPLKPGFAGTYRVLWNAYCQCNDIRTLNDNFYFNIK